MIKGINRQIIEVTDTGNIYYERALLVLRPEYTGAQRAVLEREAKRILNTMKAPSSIKKKHIFSYWFLRLGCAGIAGSFITLLILNLINT